MIRIIFVGMLVLFTYHSQRTQLNLEASEIASGFNKGSELKTIAAEFLISTYGIGKAKLGMTLGELKQNSDHDTEFEPISPFAGDLNAIAVSKRGIVQYYILYSADSRDKSVQFTPTDSDVITRLMTNNYNYQTEAGVKVGTPIQEAEDLYGDATLAYNVEGQSVEYISFDDYIPQNIRFRASYFKLISDGLGFSGIYPEYPGAVYTTDKYKPEAAIAAIEVFCHDDECSD
ncbi:MAG: hypothetical protein HC930_04960 [Hydrococcus sp. SU_1_0]|nr:hypothetical protein [Hydrococcus sp. SU_1_0]